MASWDHEGIVELFRSDPGLAVALLWGPLGLELPSFEARVETGALTSRTGHHRGGAARLGRRQALLAAGVRGFAEAPPDARSFFFGSRIDSELKNPRVVAQALARVLAKEPRVRLAQRDFLRDG